MQLNGKWSMDQHQWIVRIGSSAVELQSKHVENCRDHSKSMEFCAVLRVLKKAILHARLLPWRDALHGWVENVSGSKPVPARFAEITSAWSTSDLSDKETSPSSGWWFHAVSTPMKKLSTIVNQPTISNIGENKKCLNHQPVFVI